MAGEIRDTTIDGITTVMISNPDRKNAITVAMLDALAALMQDAPGEAVILWGDDEVFCAGADLTELGDAVGAGSLEGRLARAADAIAECPVPVVAAIEGPCLGAAVELAAACDIRVTSATAFFEVPAARLGILYRPAGVERLMSRLGSHAARRLLLANERMSAEALGPFTAPLVAPGTAYYEATRIAGHIVTLSRPAVEATKRLLGEIEAGDLDPAAWESLRDELRQRSIG